jgi:membrane protein implicated in regulation of membrane protease activity
MSSKIKILAIIQAVFAFIIVFALNYFALGMSGALSFTGALGFTLLLGGWAAYRYKRYLKKQEKKSTQVSASEEKKSDNKNVKD